MQRRALGLVTMSSLGMALAACSGQSPSASARTLDVHSVNWQIVSAPGAACFASKPVPLRGGQALIPNPHGNPIQPGTNGRRFYQLALTEQPVYGVLGSSNDTVAAVGLGCSNNGGTGAGILLTSVAVFSGAGGRLQPLGLLTPQVQPQGSQPTLIQANAVTPGKVTVEERFYGPRDPDCCPTGRATTVWTWSDSRFQPRTKIVQEAQR